MKKTTRLLLAGISASAIAGLCALGGVSALAEKRDFTEKYDKVFEDFARADISDTTTGNDKAGLGEKAYLSVEFDAANSGTPDGPIFKQGQPGDTGVGNIVLLMRAPKGDVTLDELVLGTRYSDNHLIYSKPLSELCDGDAGSLPALTTTWQKYILNFANSYEDAEVYKNNDGTDSTVKVNDGKIVGMHIYAAAEASGTIEIQSVYTTTDATDAKPTSRTMWNDFVGADTVDKTKSDTAWWAGSAQGVIQKRRVELSGGGELTVKNEKNKAGDYGYAVVEATGDTANLKVSLSSDAVTWGTAAAFADSYEVESSTCAFKFTYTGTESVSIDRIFWTNYEVDKVAAALPVIDAKTTSKLDDFNVSQTGFNEDYEAMRSAPQMKPANLYYRLSYSHGDLVSIKDGALVFDASTLAANDYINFKTQRKETASARFVVLKIKADGGATLDGFRFALGTDGTVGEPVSKSGWKADVGLAAPGLDESNPYEADGWKYVVIDIAESGLAAKTTGLDTINMYYSGTGKLYIDEIFFADKAAPEVKDVRKSDASVDFKPTADDYEYAGFVGNLSGVTDKYNVLAMTIEIAKDTDLAGVRFQFTGSDEWRWASRNAQGSLVLTDGTLLADAGFKAGEVKTVYIDLARSKLDAVSDFHIHSNGKATGAFKITDVRLQQHTELADVVIPDEDAATRLNVKDSSLEGAFTPTGEGYAYLTFVSAPNLDKKNSILHIELTADTALDLSGMRFEFAAGANSVATRWFGENAQGTFKTIYGGALQTTLAAGGKIVYDIDISDVAAFDGFHVHSNGASTGNFTVTKAYIAPKADYYAAAVAALPVYGDPDLVKPTVTIQTPNTAKAGETVTIAYTASDDVTAAEDLQVTIVVKKGAETVALTDGKSFVAEEGVYTVTVTAEDEMGNSQEATLQITVTKAGDVTNPDNGCKGCKSAASAGIVSLVALAGAAIILFKKRK